jgi:hypothetical protein
VPLLSCLELSCHLSSHLAEWMKRLASLPFPPKSQPLMLLILPFPSTHFHVHHTCSIYPTGLITDHFWDWGEQDVASFR